jgi:hypothetical protein
MLKTAKWDGFVGNDGAKPRVMTAAERQALIYAPFPVVKMATTQGHSQAPWWVAQATQQNNEGW